MTMTPDAHDELAALPKHPPGIRHTIERMREVFLRHEPIEAAPDPFVPIHENVGAFPTTMHAEFEEVLTAAREIEMRRYLLRLGIPPIGPPTYGPLPPLPDHIAYSLTAYRAIHGGQLPELHEQRERRTLYLTQGRARSRP
jgi:hypothetical protein